MAASAERLIAQLRAAGFNPATVTITSDSSADVTFATKDPATLAAAYNWLATQFVWSDAAENAWKASLETEKAVQMITSPEPLPLAVRAACIALMQSLIECREKVNEILAAVKAGNVAAVEALQTGTTPEQAFALVATLIQSGQIK